MGIIREKILIVRKQSLALIGSIMHISGDFWANLPKGRDAKLPIYGIVRAATSEVGCREWAEF
jgi:hypothetical protein